LAKRQILFSIILVAFPAISEARGGPPIADAVGLNIGLNCQWQRQCMAAQDKAMKRALSYVRKEQPPTWRVHLCNRNASRGRYRVDWVGFNNCIRNAALRPPPPPRTRQLGWKHRGAT
jgi:hypothetical protein